MTDSKIAERLAVEVMGWHRGRGILDLFEDTRFWYSDDKNRPEYLLSQDTDAEDNGWEVWMPLTNIEQALVVLEKLFARNLSVDIYGEAGSYRVTIVNNAWGGNPIEMTGRADTFARAVCLAAVATLG